MPTDVTLVPYLEAASLARISPARLTQLVATEDFPAPMARGIFSRAELAIWLRDRKAGKPLRSGRILRSWLPEASATALSASEAQQMAKADPMQIQLWVRRGDFPKPICHGIYSRPAVEQWVRDRQAGKPMASSQTPRAWQREPSEGTYSLSELPALTRCDPTAIYAMTKRHDFPAPIPGLRGKYPRSQVDAWVEARKRGKRLPSGKGVRSWGIQAITVKQRDEAMLHNLAPLDPQAIRSLVAQSAMARARDAVLPPGTTAPSQADLEAVYQQTLANGPTDPADLEAEQTMLREWQASQAPASPPSHQTTSPSHSRKAPASPNHLPKPPPHAPPEEAYDFTEPTAAQLEDDDFGLDFEGEDD